MLPVSTNAPAETEKGMDEVGAHTETRQQRGSGAEVLDI